MHRADCVGETFKLLGVLIDPKLLMVEEIHRINQKNSTKVKAILSTKGCYSTTGMVQQHNLKQAKVAADQTHPKGELGIR